MELDVRKLALKQTSELSLTGMCEVRVQGFYLTNFRINEPQCLTK